MNHPTSKLLRQLARAVGGVAVAATLGACPKRVSEAEAPQTPAEVVTLAFVTGLQGAVEPCPGAGDAVGGLGRLAARLEALRAEGPLALFVVGDTFFPPGDSPGLAYAQEQHKARTIAAVLARLAPLAILSGPGDHGPHGEQVKRLAAEFGLPLLAAPRSGPRQFRLDNAVSNVGGLRLGFLGVPGNPMPEVLSYAAGANALRVQKASIVIGLLGISGEPVEALLKRTVGINVAVTGGSAPSGVAQRVGPTLMVAAGSGGRALGLLRLHRNGARAPEAKDWLYDDGRRTMPSPDDPTVEVPRPPPEGPTVTWEVEPIGAANASAAWADQLIAESDLELTRLAATIASDACPPAGGAVVGYVGDAECVRCHAAAATVHRTTAHAKAWPALKTAGKESDLSCAACHAVGFARPGGWCRPADAPTRGGVGCESCHGPGAGHAAQPEVAAARGATFVAEPDATVCLQCHRPALSPTFDATIARDAILGPGHGRPAVEPSLP